MLGRLDASDKWMIIWFTPHQTNTLPKWMFIQKLFFKSSLLINSSAAFKYVPQTIATTFAFSFVCFFFYDTPVCIYIGIQELKERLECGEESASATVQHWMYLYWYSGAEGEAGEESASAAASTPTQDSQKEEATKKQESGRRKKGEKPSKTYSYFYHGYF